MARSAALAALAAAALASTASSFSVIPEHSFEPPFGKFDGNGMRVIDNWRPSGAAILNEYFIRLTPDRQSKRAALWNSARLDRDEWSVTIRFRVSGQGKRLFGDGFALWLTGAPAHIDGPLHGFQSTFKGFGVIFDTFVNTEPGHVHRDIQLVSSDGATAVDLNDPATAGNPVGCDADFR
jgi:lectin, mannose-binding 2